MPNSAATVAVDQGGPLGYRVFVTESGMEVYGTISISAGNYPAGGLALNFGVAGVQTAALTPYDVEIYSVAASPGLFQYTWDATNNKMHILTASAGAAQSAPYVELTGGNATPAGVTGDTIRFHAVLLRT